MWVKPSQLEAVRENLAAKIDRLADCWSTSLDRLDDRLVRLEAPPRPLRAGDLVALTEYRLKSPLGIMEPFHTSTKEFVVEVARVRGGYFQYVGQTADRWHAAAEVRLVDRMADEGE